MPGDLTPVPFSNLLLVRPRFLGDILLSTGLASAAKAARPRARVSFLADARFADILRGHPDIDEVLTFDTDRKNSLRYLFRFLRDLRRRRFDCVLDLFGNPRTAQWTFLSGAPVRVGYQLRGRSWAYNRLAFPSSDGRRAGGRRRVTEVFLDQWRALGYPPPDRYRTYAHVTGQEFAAVDSRLSSLGWRAGEGLAVLSPGASWPAKRWPVEKFLMLSERLAALGLTCVFTLGPKDQDLLPVLEARRGKALLINQPTLRELAALIATAEILVSNDAGPMHVGPAVGTPTVGIFGPGEPDIWFPYEEPHRAAYREVECSHCGLDFCDRMECMKALSVESVLESCRQALETGASRAGAPS